jgi:peptide/nickel transport system substrate-binding protein
MKLSTLRRIALLGVFVTLWTVTACRNSSQPVTPLNQQPQRERVLGKRGGALKIRVNSPPQSFNYLKATDEASVVVAFYLMGGRLAEFDHDSGKYAPGIAETWKQAEDGRTVDVTLRDGLKFSDGHPLTAEDVAFTFRALYDPHTASPVFRDAMLVAGREIEVTVTDERHLRLIFPETVAAPENYLSNLAVLPRHALEAEFNQGTLSEAYGLNTDPQRVIVAGAFTLMAAIPSERIMLRRNPHYWKKDGAGTPLPYLDELAIEIVSDANNAIARVKQGSLDICDRIRPADYAALHAEAAGPARALDAGPGLATDHLWFNLNRTVNPAKLAWFSDVRFRRAVSHAIDRETLASVTLQGLATPLYGFVSPGNRAWVANDLARTAYDLDKARALLREAGFVLRNADATPELYDAKGNRVELTLIVPIESQPRSQMATVVQEDLAKLGIKLQIAPIEFGELTRRISQSFEYDAALLGASASEPDPSSYTNLLRSSSPTNSWHPKQASPATAWEARIDELIAAQSHEINVERRRTLFREVQQILAEQLPVIPIVSRHLVTASNRRAGNHRPSALLPYSLWNTEELFVH